MSPWRRGRYGSRADYDTERYDRHGIPRCKHCGGEGRFVSFDLNPKTAPPVCVRVWLRRGEGKRMSINCDEKWRFLIPLWRNTEAYIALRRSSR